MQLRCRVVVLGYLAVLVFPVWCRGEIPSSAERVRRSFRFRYAGAIDGVSPGELARVWLPLPTGSPQQRIRLAKLELPGPHRFTRERKYGNPLIYFEATGNQDGRIPFDIEYECVRFERSEARTESASPCERALFLRPTRLIPLDGSLLAGWAPRRHPRRRTITARDLYDAVDLHMKYSKPPGKPWGRGDVKWACDSGYGNCTDFHSLFLAACRFHGIPARFEIGFPLPADRTSGEVAGYHCWASFEYRGQWIPVDISEADKHPERRDYFFGRLDPNRIRFTIGRDLELEPPNATGPVNYLIYPHVEIGGCVHRRLVKRFSFEEIGKGEG